MGVITRGKILRDDLAHWDGVTKTASRLDATGGTVTGLTVGDHVDVLQVFGAGTDRTAATANTAITALGGNAATLVFATGTWTIDANVTIPATLASRIPAGCVFSIDSGITLTFAGPVHVEHSTWYTGDGAVSCSVGASGFPGW